MPGYTQSDGITLKNKFGATDAEALERLETEATLDRLVQIGLGLGPKGSFDVKYLKELHRFIFQDAYEWAGRTRDERVALSDGTVASEPILRKTEGQPFVVGPEISERLDAVATQLRDANYFRDLPREQFAESAADVMAELNSIHPFREGNGRTQRVFVEQLVQAAGHDLDFTVVSKERMVQASIAAHEQGDLSMMRRMFDEISDPRRGSLLRDSIASLEKLGFPWNQRYIATVSPAFPVEMVFAGVAKDQFMARTSSEILFGWASDLPDPIPQQGEAFVMSQKENIDGSIEAGTAAVLDGVGNLAEGAIVSLADNMAEFLGGGSSYAVPAATPTPLTPQEERDSKYIEYLQTLEQQQEARQAQQERAQGARDLTNEQDQTEEHSADRDRGLSR